MQRQLRQMFTDQKGFTLIELLIVVSIIGIVVAVSAPKMSEYVTNADLRGDATRLMAGLKFARMEAVKRNDDCSVTFAQVVNGTTYDYVVFVDAGADLEFDAADDEVILLGEYKRATEQANSIVVNDDGLPAVKFTSRGIPLNNTNGFSGGTVTLSVATGNERDVVFNSTGRIRIE